MRVAHVDHLSKKCESVCGFQWRGRPESLYPRRKPDQVTVATSLGYCSSINRDRNSSCHQIPLVRRLRSAEWKAPWKGAGALIITDAVLLAILGRSSFVPLLISIEACHSCPAVTFGLPILRIGCEPWASGDCSPQDWNAQLEWNADSLTEWRLNKVCPVSPSALG